MLLDWQDFKLECTFSGLIQNHNDRRMWQLPSIERILLKGNILKYSDIYQQKKLTHYNYLTSVNPKVDYSKYNKVRYKQQFVYHNHSNPRKA